MDKAFEIWKDINGFEGIYQISDKGNIRSLDRKIICSNGSIRFQRGSGIKPYINKQGYRTVVLHNIGKHKMCRICRLVAEAFIPNPQNLPQVNHKDENKTNNCLQNLEWCDAKYNINYGTKIDRQKKPILQYDLDGNFIREWSSATDVSKEAQENICKCLKGIRKTAYGFIWKYKEDI